MIRRPPRSTLFPHDALPISQPKRYSTWPQISVSTFPSPTWLPTDRSWAKRPGVKRSEEHTSELQSLRHLVCRLLLEKKNIRGCTVRLKNGERRWTMDDTGRS